MAVESITPELAGFAFAALFFIGIMVLFGLLSYVLMSVSLMVIARKTGVQRRWQAWVPLVQLYLLARTGKRSYLLPNLLVGIFVLSILSEFLFAARTTLIIQLLLAVPSMALTVPLYWSTFKQRNYPGPLSLLMLVPVANIIVLLIVAFNDQE